jgi:phage/plasmid-like protein (TIGR03299 family)
MAHELEFVNGQASMAYAGDVPWHGLGVKVSNDLTPDQMLKAAGLDWTVDPVELFAEVGDRRLPTGHRALVRSSDQRVIDVITNDWNPVQNSEAFEFFNDFVAHGDMSMETAGSLKDGKIIWALAKVKDSFDLFGGKDRVDAYLHFTNPHQYGQSIDVRFTPIRVVCNNTLTLSLNTKSKNMVKVSHRREFDPEQVKEALGVAKHKLAKYKEMAEFLSQKRYQNEDVVDYFKRIFPVLTTKQDSKKELSNSAERALDIVKFDSQPGAEFGKGTYWELFNTVTYMTDHEIGRSVDARLTSAWYGANKNLKTKALETAVEMADAA